MLIVGSIKAQKKRARKHDLWCLDDVLPLRRKSNRIKTSIARLSGDDSANIQSGSDYYTRARLTLDGSYLPSLRQVGRLNAAFERSIWGKWSELCAYRNRKIDNREIQPRRVYLLIPCNFACPRRILGLHSRATFTKVSQTPAKRSIFFCVPYWASFIANLPRTRWLFRLLIPILSRDQIENLSFELTGN